jgi:hypothetical protein
MEKGKYALTVHHEVSKELKREELLMLLEGLSFSEMKQGKRFKIK